MEDVRSRVVQALLGEPVESDEEEFESQPVDEESGTQDEFEEEESQDLEEETVVDASDDEEADEEVAEGHRVPYARFKQINDRRHALQAELAERERVIAELEDRISKHSKAPQREEYYEEDPVFSDDDPDDIKYLKQQTQEMQIKFATMELEREVGDAMQQYPNVPEEYIWDALASDGNQNASDVAARYAEWVAEVEEAAINRYLSEAGGQEAAPAPPRPRRKQSATSASSGEEWRPKTTDEAREAMIAFLRS